MFTVSRLRLSASLRRVNRMLSATKIEMVRADVVQETICNCTIELASSTLTILLCITIRL